VRNDQLIDALMSQAFAAPAAPLERSTRLNVSRTVRQATECPICTSVRLPEFDRVADHNGGSVRSRPRRGPITQRREKRATYGILIAEYLLSTAALADCVSGVHIFRFCT
jgi:hypothetical protein